jgi:hypothetical protein
MRVGGVDRKVRAVAGIICLGGAALPACGSSHSPATDAGAGGTPIFLGLEHQWFWTPITGMRCRDGSSTGIGVNASHTSPNVVVFLDLLAGQIADVGP